MSFGGRLVILKFVLSNLPLYFFSFYKAPKNVIKKPINLQRNFLWTGETQPKKISWVAWDQICKPKHEGGSGVKCLEMFSLSLLSKWRLSFTPLLLVSLSSSVFRSISSSICIVNPLLLLWVLFQLGSCLAY